MPLPNTDRDDLVQMTPGTNTNLWYSVILIIFLKILTIITL